MPSALRYARVVLTSDDFVLHRAFGGDVVELLREAWTSELQERVEALLLESAWVAEPSSPDVLVARVGAPMAATLRAALSARALETLQDALRHSRERSRRAAFWALFGSTLGCVAIALGLLLLWLRGFVHQGAFLFFGALVVPLVIVTFRAWRLLRTDGEVHGF